MSEAVRAIMWAFSPAVWHLHPPTPPFPHCRTEGVMWKLKVTVKAACWDESDWAELWSELFNGSSVSCSKQKPLQNLKYESDDESFCGVCEELRSAVSQRGFAALRWMKSRWCASVTERMKMFTSPVWSVNERTMLSHKRFIIFLFHPKLHFFILFPVNLCFVS